MQRKTLSLIATLLLMVPALAHGQTQTGTITGIVSDPQGAVLPGVTVSIASPALIEGSRKAITGEGGNYQFVAVPPGLYSITFEISGFQRLERRDIRVSVAFVTKVDAQLQIAAVEETVTVVGESPVVDVKQTVRAVNIDKELYEAVPTGRNPWVMAGLVPGMVTGRLDVGGNDGMQQYNLEVFGSANSQKSFSIDGLKTNWPGGDGGATMQYYDFGMYEEYNFQTSNATAEVDVAGVYMNMVTKSGGNTFGGDHVLYFMNDGLQGDNLDDELIARFAGNEQLARRAGSNPIDISYDWNSTLGGPIVGDRAWFFGSIRWWRLDQFQVGAVNPDGSQAIDDNRIRNFMGKVTYQATQEDKLSFMFNRNLKDRFHRRDPPYLFTDDKASFLQDQPAQNFILQYNRILNTSTFLDVRFGRMWGTFPNRYQKEVTPTDIAIRDSVRFTRINAAEQAFENPNHRWQYNTSLSYFRDDWLGGYHDMKFGVQIGRERMGYRYRRNGDYLLELRDGVPFVAVLANTPVNQESRVNTWGIYAQDNWTIKQRLTVNLGVRIDAVHGFLPSQSSPAGTFVGERNFPKIDDTPDWPANAAPRIGFALDVFGNGKTAIKGGYGRYYVQIGSELPDNVNPNGFSQATVRWTDLNGNLALDPGELGPFTGFVGGVTTTFDPDAERPYSDEFTIGFDHTLATDLAVSVSYHRRHHRRGLGIRDLARPPAAYTPQQRTFSDPIDGQQTITVHNLDPALVALRQRLITNVDLLRSDYDGLNITLTKKFSNSWQLLGGLTVQDHTGFFHDGTFTNFDFNNPNVLIGREDSSIFTDVPYVFNLSASYILPYDVVLAGKYTYRTGDPLRRLLVVGALTQASETIMVVPRATDRNENVDKFIDLRIGKKFRFGDRYELAGTVDVFNLLNANHVLLQTEAIGTAFARPLRILTPRIVRFGVNFSF